MRAKWLSQSSRSTGMDEILEHAALGPPLAEPAMPCDHLWLSAAAADGDVDRVEALLSSGGSTCLTEQDAHGDTPLHRAAWNGHAGVVELLARRGASVAAMNIGGGTPLYLASSEGHLACVAALLDLGADLNQADHMGDCPLHDAACYGEPSAGGGDAYFANVAPACI